MGRHLPPPTPEQIEEIGLGEFIDEAKAIARSVLAPLASNRRLSRQAMDIEVNTHWPVFLDDAWQQLRPDLPF